MQYYLFPDIVFNLLKYLNKNSSFNLINASNHLITSKNNLYNKYVYNHSKIKNNNIKKHIKIIKDVPLDPSYVAPYEKLIEIKNIIHLSENTDLDKCLCKFILNVTVHKNIQLDLCKFNKLTTLSIHSDQFNQSLDYLPNTLTSLFIVSSAFNQPINKLPPNLNLLFIVCFSLNQSLDSLPNTLKMLIIRCDKFNQSLDHLPNALNTLCIYGSNVFTHSFNQLPNTLELLYIKIDTIDGSLDNLPNSLKSLHIECSTINKLPYNLPKSLDTIMINGKKIK